MNKPQMLYHPSWEKDNLWLKECPDDIYSATCKVCEVNFSISNGLNSIEQHEKSNEHQDTLADAVTNAEIMWALVYIETDLSFDSDLGVSMSQVFSDSEIAKHLAKDLTPSKMKLIVQYGIAEYFEGFTSSNAKVSRSMNDAKRMIKDTVQCFGSSVNVPITKSLIETVKRARNKCDEDYNHSTGKGSDVSRSEEDHEEDLKVIELDKLNSKLKQIIHGLQVADDIIEKSNDDVKSCMTQEKSKKRKETLKRSKVRFITSMKRKQQLNDELESLSKKIEELKALY